MRTSRAPPDRDAFSGKSHRTGWFQGAGAAPALTHPGRIIDINLRTWTVDVQSQFDQKTFFNLGVMSPYAHHHSGEGFFVMPEVGATCYVHIPSDGPPPFVLGFNMTAEPRAEGDIASDDEIGVTYAGGRPRPKPGDMGFRGRDGNFCVLHRGGVVQIGSSLLAQRLYLPLDNIVTDITQTYQHYNSGGSVSWAPSLHESEDNPPTLFRQTFRRCAGEEHATVRVSVGSFRDVAPDAFAGDGDGDGELAKLGMGTEPVVVEVAVAKEGFDAATGKPVTGTRASHRLFFDQGGGAYLGCQGSLLIRLGRTLRVAAVGKVHLSSGDDAVIESKTLTRVSGETVLELNGGVVRVNGGKDAVAYAGAVVEVITPATPPLQVATPSGPGTVVPGQRLVGVIKSGKPLVLV